MKTYFVSRHKGALDWAAEQGITVDEVVHHLEVENIKPHDVVIGSLPVNLAAAICHNGGRYLHLVLNLPFDKRGQELTSEDMRQYGATLTEYIINKAN